MLTGSITSAVHGTILISVWASIPRSRRLQSITTSRVLSADDHTHHSMSSIFKKLHDDVFQTMFTDDLELSCMHVIIFRIHLKN